MMVAGTERSPRRYLAAVLAILALYVQLAAAGLCAAGLMAAPADAAGAFPICHAPGDASEATKTGSSQDDPQPAHRHACPFCAVHCHAAMAAASQVASVAARAAVVTHRDLPSSPVIQSVRFPAGTPPRGPPLSM